MKARSPLALPSLPRCGVASWRVPGRRSSVSREPLPLSRANEVSSAMADDETVNRVPAIAFKGVEDLWNRMAREVIPDKFDRKYLADKAEGTQFGYRQAF